MSMVFRTALTVLAGIVAVPFTPVSHPASVSAPDQSAGPAAYAATAKEAYLAPEALTYIRPGFNIKIQSVTNFAPGMKPVVEVFLTDDAKGPLDRNGLATPGVISMRFIPAVWDPATRRYLNYIGYDADPLKNQNPGRDNTGTWQDLEVGHYKYTFAFTLPATTDPSKPHTLAAMGSRNTSDIVGKTYWAVPQYVDFVPATNTAATTFNATTIARCNQCHDPLGAHGGVRQEAKLCILCHSPQNTDPDTGNLLDMRVFIHKIHRGENLPSVQAGTPYHIVGNATTSTGRRAPVTRPVHSRTTTHARPATFRTAAMSSTPRSRGLTRSPTARSSSRA